MYLLAFCFLATLLDSQARIAVSTTRLKPLPLPFQAAALACCNRSVFVTHSDGVGFDTALATTECNPMEPSIAVPTPLKPRSKQRLEPSVSMRVLAVPFGLRESSNPLHAEQLSTLATANTCIVAPSLHISVSAYPALPRPSTWLQPPVPALDLSTAFWRAPTNVSSITAKRPSAPFALTIMPTTIPNAARLATEGFFPVMPE